MKNIEELLFDFKYSEIEIRDIEIELKLADDKEKKEKLLEIKKAKETNRSKMLKAFNKLNAKKKRVLELFYLSINKMRISEIANEMSYSESYTRAIKDTALAELREYYK